MASKKAAAAATNTVSALRVKVKDGMTGFYGMRRRRGGSVFTLDKPGDFSERWMDRVDTHVRETDPHYDAPQKAIYDGGGAPPRMVGDSPSI